MKYLRPLLAGLLVLAAGVPRASLVSTINVTTDIDEDGANSAACSLREAVKAISTKKPFGGCPAGNAFTDNLIQLEPVTYVLTRGELKVGGETFIVGKDSQKAVHDEQVDPLTGTAPRRFRPDYVDVAAAVGKTGTYIVASSNSRIINSTAPLTLQDLVLVGSASPTLAVPTSVADNGGVIFAASAILLDNVIVRGGRAVGSGAGSGNGGAIYLGGEGSALTLTDTTLEGNRADQKGGAVAMLCTVGISPHVQHSVSVTRSLLRGNTSVNGAGAIEICGDTSASLTASTLSGNSSGIGSGAITYVQGAPIGLGIVSLSYVTAAEQVGHVLAINGIGSVQINSSLLAAFDTSGAGPICHNPDAAVYWMESTPASGTNNAIDNDGSCTALLAAAGNAFIPLLTPLTDVLVPIPDPSDYYPATSAGAPFGLTDYYLPKLSAASPILDKGEPLVRCVVSDQRNTPRRSGALCDIGAVERLQASPRDDTAINSLKTDRVAIVDVLENDSFGEHDTTGPYKFSPNTPDDPATVVNEASPPVVFAPGGNAGGRCEWIADDGSENAGKMVVSNDGLLAGEAAPVVCTYQVVDTEPRTSVATATVTVQIRNAPPNALNDAYLRPVGTTTISFDPMINDNDEGDGKYGLVAHPDPDAPTDRSLFTWGPETAWATFYPIEIDGPPALGEVVGTTSGVCPGSSAIPRICLTPPLRYIAKNNMAPFEDSFTYRVHDLEGQPSNSATVTIYTDAQDPDHGGGAGSFDLLGGLVLSLLGLRRLRRL